MGEDSSLNPIRIESISENLGWLLAGYPLLLGRIAAVVHTTTILFLSQAVFIVINQDVMMTLKHTYHWEFFEIKLSSKDHYLGIYDKNFFQHIVVSVSIKSL